MSEAAAPASEAFVLARRGLPLAGSVPAQPRAAWLPAAARSRVQAVAARPELVLQANDEDEAGEDDAWWGERESAPASNGVETDGDAGVRATPRGEQSPPQGPARDAAGAQMPAHARDGEPAGHEAGAPADAPAAPAPDRLVPGSPQAQHAPSGQGPPRAFDAAPAPTRETGAVAAAGTGAEPATTRMPAAVSSQPGAAPTQRPLPAFAAPDHVPPAVPVRGDNQVDVLRVSSMQPSAAADAVVTHALERTVGELPLGPVSPAQARRDELPAAVRTLLMGLPADGAADLPRPASAPDLTLLLAPAAAPQRSVTIDRIAVTVQAPAAPPAPPAAAPALPAPQRTTAGAAPAFRNPWASYHARRD